MQGVSGFELELAQIRRVSGCARRSMMVLSLALFLSACGGGEDSSTTVSTAEKSNAGAVASISNTRNKDSVYDRASFVLCDALEPHREELAAIAGFEQDPDRSLSMSRSECVVRGLGGDFLRVKLQPAMVPSAEAVATMSYDGEASPAPELGAEAWYVDDYQPHVIFPVGGLILDVASENATAPDRATMIELATRVRELLRNANS